MAIKNGWSFNSIIRTIRKLVASGVGLGLMVGAEAEDAARRKEATVLKPRVATLDLSVIYLKQRESEPMVDIVVQTICEIWNQA